MLVSVCDVGGQLEEPQYLGFDRRRAASAEEAQVPASFIAFIVFAMPRMLVTRFAPGRRMRPSDAKYRDESGNVWSGRGPRPGWFKAALAAGKAAEEFLLKQQSPEQSRLMGATGKTHSAFRP